MMCSGLNSRTTAGMAKCVGPNSSSGGELKLYLGCTVSTLFLYMTLLTTLTTYNNFAINFVTVCPRYLKAKHSEGRYVLVPPYKDASSGQMIVTLGKTVTVSRWVQGLFTCIVIITGSFEVCQSHRQSLTLCQWWRLFFRQNGFHTNSAC